ncbi:hypothetical protein [Chengkuizengella sediminis]|uniref:hypothetical protein n=1 Tax=Chengkuizengella sediminis TaxID=1885917 RepID=UPI00138A3468|nr:hypothetical protein [Chengkuizengella sediminis]NDI37177.1 hypothetical protein [Chengkuizengella sediminis]
MGVFDKTICDCCVGPMQCVLEQLMGKEIIFNTFGGSLCFPIMEVKNFIVSGEVFGGQKATIPICNITTIRSLEDEQFTVNLKPIQKNIKGECVCCENPITNFTNSLPRGEEVLIRLFDQTVEGTIGDVGQGLVIVEEENQNVAVSSCVISFILTN